MVKKRKRIIVLWADDDWANFSLEDYKFNLVEKIRLGCFHYTKKGCYEGKVRKVRITIEEL